MSNLWSLWQKWTFVETHKSHPDISTQSFWFQWGHYGSRVVSLSNTSRFETSVPGFQQLLDLSSGLDVWVKALGGHPGPCLASGNLEVNLLCLNNFFAYPPFYVSALEVSPATWRFKASGRVDRLTQAMFDFGPKMFPMTRCSRRVCVHGLRPWSVWGPKRHWRCESNAKDMCCVVVVRGGAHPPTTTRIPWATIPADRESNTDKFDEHGCSEWWWPSRAHTLRGPSRARSLTHKEDERTRRVCQRHARDSGVNKFVIRACLLFENDTYFVLDLSWTNMELESKIRKDRQLFDSMVVNSTYQSTIIRSYDIKTMSIKRTLFSRRSAAYHLMMRLLDWNSLLWRGVRKIVIILFSLRIGNRMELERDVLSLSFIFQSFIFHR